MSAFAQLCSAGDLAGAQAEADMFGLTAAAARAGDNAALKWACHNGHLPVAEWLTKRFGLTAADARAGDKFAFRFACENGHLPVAHRKARSAFCVADRQVWPDGDRRAS